MPYDYDSAEHQLRLAAKAGDMEAVLNLLEQGVNIDAAPAYRTTAFHLAERYGHREVARALLLHGATVTLDDASNLEQLKFLMENGVAEPTLEQKRRGLQYACKRHWMSEQQMEIALGNLPDPTLTERVTVEEAEVYIHAKGNFQFSREHWEMMKARMQPGDELWKFNADSHNRRLGWIRNRGYVLLRQGRHVAKIRRNLRDFI